MAIYKKKPITIEAFQLGIDYIPDWFMDKVTSNDIILHGSSSGFEHHDDTSAEIKTLEGTMHADFGDYIIRGIKGEIYPCKPDIFEATYEKLDSFSIDVIEASKVRELCDQIKMRFYYHFDELIPSVMEDEIEKLLKEYLGKA